MYDTLRSLLDGNQFSVVESFEISGRTARYAPIPRFLFESSVGPYLDRRVRDANSGRSQLWTHQAQALEALGDRNNVVISTGTASGKSLIFQAHVFHQTLINSSNRVLVFYPLKALEADQLRAWQQIARLLDLPEEVIGRIDGSVAVTKRDDILEHARVVLMTPDVCHAWLMSRLSMPAIKRFVAALSAVVIDEAHTLEGVFGSNFAFLIRRLIAARNHVLGDASGKRSLQFVATTATIANPGEHLRRLTGMEFSVVDHEVDGAPRHDRLVAHVACPAKETVEIARQLQQHVMTDGGDGGFITFLDSRKGVESLAIASQRQPDDLVDNSAVLPYRAGYDQADREMIESRLRSGNLRGVVSTSALELGIDIPHLRVGFNVGVPATRKSFRQRLGRVGRNGPGAFVVIAEPTAFRAYGTSFREYYEVSVEPSYLYLDNRFMQFAHGRCLADELDALGASSTLPTRVTWPNGFRDVFSAAKPTGNRPPEFDAIAELGGDAPQHGYPLRNVGEFSFKIKRSEVHNIGEVSQSQALRECYPGATYLHMARPYEVAAWRTSAFEPFIQVRPGKRGRLTHPRITTWINAGVTPADLMENHIATGSNGFFVECQMQITERVDGWTDVRTDQFYSYQDLRQRNPNMRPRMRNFRTSGVVLYIELDWFKSATVRGFFADRLRELFVREYSIEPHDVGSAATNISVRGHGRNGLLRGCIAVFDQTYGSLRFTEKLYLEFDHILDRLSAATVDMQTSGTNGDLKVIGRLRTEFAGFTTSDASTAFGGTQQSEGCMMVFTPGSRVCRRQKGQIAVDAIIVQPTIMGDQLMYQVETIAKLGQRPPRHWVVASEIEPMGDGEFDYAEWNPVTQTYVDGPDDAKM